MDDLKDIKRVLMVINTLKINQSQILGRCTPAVRR